MEEVRTKSTNLVLKCPRGGPVNNFLLDLLADLGGRSVLNVLQFFYAADGRYKPITEVDKEDALDAYNAFAWDLGWFIMDRERESD